MTTILLIGKTGQVGFELERTLAPLGRLIAPDRTKLDLRDPGSIGQVITESKPDVIVSAAGLTIVDDAETSPELTMRLNASAPGQIAEFADRNGAFLVHFSTTFVFDGTKREPYTEDDSPNPINTYGRSKLAGEQAIMSACHNHLILRANWVYSARRTNFALAILKRAQEQSELSVVDDQTGSPTWAADYASATAQLLRDVPLLRDNPGIYHLSSHSHCTRLQWAKKLISSATRVSGAGVNWAKLQPTTTAQYPHVAPRPLYTVTSNRKIEETFGIRMPSWEDRIDAFVKTLPLT